MAIAFDAATRADQAATTGSFTFSHTTSGANRVLIVMCYLNEEGDLVTGITYNGVAMTRANAFTNTPGASVPTSGYIYYLANPATGANNVVISYSGNRAVIAVAASFTGANTSSPIDQSNTVYSGNDFSSTSVSLSVTTGFANSMGIDFPIIRQSTDSGGNLSITGGQTSVLAHSFSPATGLGATAVSRESQATAGTLTQSWSWTTGRRYADLLVAVREYSSTTYTITAVQGSYALSGQSSLFHYGRKIIAALGSFVLSGQATALKFGRKITAAYGSLTLTGFDALLAKGKTLVASVGTFTFTGYSTTITSVRTMVAALGSYTLAGQNALFSIGHTIVATIGSFAYTGISAALSFGRRMAAAYGSFTLTGQNATLPIARILTAAYGAISISWQSVRVLLNGLLQIYSDKYSRRNTSYSDKYSARGTSYEDKYTHL